EIRPAQATLVPDPPHVLTSNAGWDTIKEENFLKEVCDKLRAWGVRSSIFIETKPELIKNASKIGVDRIELYTGPFAENFEKNKEAAIKEYKLASVLASELKLGLNAGHDLSLANLQFFDSACTDLLEVSIGHALISDALYFGLENTIQMYLRKLAK
ncbi:MAG: pyridoxine 5-phosphate synthase, partial [Lentimonas sp.]